MLFWPAVTAKGGLNDDISSRRHPPVSGIIGVMNQAARLGGRASGRRRSVIIAACIVIACTASLAECLMISAELPWVAYAPNLCLLGLIGAGVIGFAAAGSIPAIIAFLAVLVFLTDGNFRAHSDGDMGLDWQSALKFVVWTASGVIGAAHLPRIGRIFNHGGALLWLGYICIAFLSVFFAPSPVFSFGYVLALLSFFFFTFALVEKLSEAQILWTIALTLAVFVALSWLASILDPELGQFADPTEHGIEMRMSGIAGQPVNLGSVCAIYLSAIFLLAWKRYCGMMLALSLAALGIVTLAATDSRTALFASVAGMLAVIFSRSAWLLVGMGLVAALALVGTLSFPLRLDAFGAYFSRSGDPTEALTLTGRTQIWDFTWQKIQESPFLGWGYNSSKVILAEHVGFANGLKVDSTHNLLLQNLLSVGFLGTLPLIGLFLKLMIDVGRGQPAPMSVLFLVMVFVTGITDPSALGSSPTVLTLMFMLASLSPWFRSAPLRRPLVKPLTRPRQGVAVPWAGAGPEPGT
jgi:exopolysaccharide production protein ExoQ